MLVMDKSINETDNLDTEPQKFSRWYKHIWVFQIGAEVWTIQLMLPVQFVPGKKLHIGRAKLYTLPTHKLHTPPLISRKWIKVYVCVCVHHETIQKKEGEFKKSIEF